VKNEKNDHTEKIKAVLFGVAVGDALVLPVQFRSREELRRQSVREMVGYGTFNMPPGTWSDDSSSQVHSKLHHYKHN